MAEDPQVKEALEARAFVSQSVLAKIDQCFKLIGEKPVQLSGRLQEIFLEDFRKELNEIQSPAAKLLAGKLAFVERTRRLIRTVVEIRVAERKAVEYAA